MEESRGVKRQRQFCARCGQLMFEYYSSFDGHFGVVDDLPTHRGITRKELLCPVCGSRYRLLEGLDATGHPLAKV